MIVDEVLLPKENVATRWIKTIPIKVNVFAWKLHLDRLPTRSNLLKRGIQLFLSLNVNGGNVFLEPCYSIRSGWSGLISNSDGSNLKGS
ncbi:RNA-directed DNA polymerase, eukaryota [Tanacetum coccineum]